ncbi:hypothetical protein CFB40_18925 [Burkholderia sp. AU31652]|uniref:Uncharacterized protein n=1 Tax=Burkholderia contaminans TaxID=488447 RepID=A0A6P3AXI1_9BURK|nr:MULTISPECIES: hypothetical protein [Burkholderia]MDN7491481.1 hypothetical protein [Burkholderia sp. AU45274]OXI83190.1 hypothetical protein CFB40_18925 [Burkholderia sp. AU31652]OXJ10904.1 hypothetical protein CFB45_28880 [Burkholderia sp. HI2500]VWD48236.1 hypothetical protein BCO71171_05154 [Burkholderia contaminans]
MNAKHTPIAGFRITRPTAKRGRPSSRRPLALSAEARRLLDALVTTELHHSLARVMRKSAVGHDTRTANMPVSPPRRAVFNVGRIDLSKCQLPVESIADIEFWGRRETLMHFGHDPDR